MPNLYDLEGQLIQSESLDVFLVRPSHPNSASRYSRCDVAFVISRDFTRVFIGGGEWGFDGIAREIDAVGIEALAERFDCSELKQVLEKIGKR